VLFCARMFVAVVSAVRGGVSREEGGTDTCPAHQLPGPFAPFGGDQLAGETDPHLEHAAGGALPRLKVSSHEVMERGQN